MAVVICSYDQLKTYVLQIRAESAQLAQTDKTPQSRSFNNGVVAACDRIFAGLLSWEKYADEREGR